MTPPPPLSTPPLSNLQGLAVLPLQRGTWPQLLMLRLDFDGDVAVQHCSRRPTDCIVGRKRRRGARRWPAPAQPLRLEVTPNPHLNAVRGPVPHFVPCG